MTIDLILMVCEKSQGVIAFYWNAEKVRAILFAHGDLQRRASLSSK